MDYKESLGRQSEWHKNSSTRPTPEVAKRVAAALAFRIAELELQVAKASVLLNDQHVRIHRGNPDRGSETGPGFGRFVRAQIVDWAGPGHDICCRLLEDDPHSVGTPNRAGDTGFWSVSAIHLVSDQ